MKLLKDIASKHVANLLTDNHIVAIYQGGSEAGPRALGNRSFLMSPMNKDNKNIMNVMKGREMFRPLAAKKQVNGLIC